jgi:dihydroorotase
VAVAAGRIVGLGRAGRLCAQPHHRRLGCIVLPGLVDLAARLREPGHEHEGMLESEMAAAVAGGVTSLVCPPDTDPVLDEPGLVEMLKFRAESCTSRACSRWARSPRPGRRGADRDGRADRIRLRGLWPGRGAAGQHPGAAARAAVRRHLWLHRVAAPARDALGKGVAASGPLATRLGLSGVPVAAETIALHTIFELLKTTGARVHLCRLSSAAGVELLRRAKAEGLKVTADVSINSLHLTDVDIGFFDSRARLSPPLRQQRDRDALSAALADGTIDALVSDHNPVDEDAKTLPFAEAEPGATGLELLLSLALKWSQDSGVPLQRALAAVT